MSTTRRRHSISLNGLPTPAAEAVHEELRAKQALFDAAFPVVDATSSREVTPFPEMRQRRNSANAFNELIASYKAATKRYPDLWNVYQAALKTRKEMGVRFKHHRYHQSSGPNRDALVLTRKGAEAWPV